MHTHIFLFLYFFYFLYFFIFFYYFLLFLLFLGLGPAQPTWVGLSPAGPAWPLAEASGPDGLHQSARVKWIHVCLELWKVIKLPSHSVLATQIQLERRTKMDGDDVPASENREETCWTVVPLASFLFALPFCSCAHDLLFTSSRFKMKESTVKTPVYCGC